MNKEDNDMSIFNDISDRLSFNSTNNSNNNNNKQITLHLVPYDQHSSYVMDKIPYNPFLEVYIYIYYY